MVAEVAEVLAAEAEHEEGPVDLDNDQDCASLPAHRWVVHLVRCARVLVEKQHGKEALPDLPRKLSAPKPPEHDSDIDELVRILRENPAIVQGIKTGDFRV